MLCSNKDNSTPVVIVCRAGMSTAQAFEHSLESCVRGFHVNKDVWTPVLNECLQTRQELGNPKDRYAVAVCKADGAASTVGHVLMELSRIFWYFLQNNGEITCKITGSRRRSPLVQGGLEIPCLYKFVGEKKHILRELLMK